MFCCPTQHLRQRQMRNLAAALLLAHGVPMVVMGDEYGHSKVLAWLATWRLSCMCDECGCSEMLN